MGLKHETGNAALDALRNFVRYNTHGGYSWAAVTGDGDLICEPCARADYRELYRATRDKLRGGWRIVGLVNSGEAEETELCACCNRAVWTIEEAQS